MRCIKQKMEEFLWTSGLAVNLQKSEVFLVGVFPDAAAVIIQYLSMVRGCLPVRYLGVPLRVRSLHISRYNGLVMKMVNKVITWSTKHISYVGH